MATTVIRKIDPGSVVKLDDTNYERWKLQITLLLQSAELWPLVTGRELRHATDVDKQAEWDKKDIEARAILITTLGDLQTTHIYNCLTAKQVYDKLRDVNSDTSTLNKQQTQTKFLTYKIAPGANIVHAYQELQRLGRSLNLMGVATDDSTIVTMIVSALPDEFIPFKKAWIRSPMQTKQCQTYSLV